MKLDVVEIRVNHWEEMVDWYHHTLGLKLIVREDDDRFALLSGEGGAMVGLYGVKSKTMKTSSAVALYWRIEDIDGSVEKFSTRGISFPTGIEDRHWGRQAQFADPEGNKHFLYQEKPA